METQYKPTVDDLVKNGWTYDYGHIYYEYENGQSLGYHETNLKDGTTFRVTGRLRNYYPTTLDELNELVNEIRITLEIEDRNYYDYGIQQERDY